MSFFNLDPTILVARLIVLIVAFTIHEFAHAWTATRFGDNTPRMYGRLTLNPLAHLDPMGSLLLIVAGFGWAKPVPVNVYALSRSSPSALMWVSLAGPFSNFIMAILAAIPLRLGLVSPYGQSFFDVLFSEFVYINLLLMLFNLIPISPLDGEKIAYYLLPPPWPRWMDTIRPYGPIILLAVAVVGPMLGLPILNWILFAPLNLLYGLLVA
jgi:Zn-dependent protease